VKKKSAMMSLIFVTLQINWHKLNHCCHSLAITLISHLFLFESHNLFHSLAVLDLFLCLCMLGKHEDQIFIDVCFEALYLVFA